MAVVAMALIAVAFTSVWDTSKADAPPRPRQASATLALNPRVRPVAIPPSYFGLSTEYWLLPLDDGHLRAFEHLLTLVHARDGGPEILRIGGDSADATFLQTGDEAVPAGGFALTRSWFERAAVLVRQAKLRVILDLNGLADSPEMAAGWARMALTYFPRGSVLGFEIGNEPNIYARHLYLLHTLHPPRLTTVAGLGAYTPADYVDTFRAYAAALRSVAPGIPLLGPAVASPAPDVAWLRALAGADLDVGMLTAHRYPLSACIHHHPVQHRWVCRRGHVCYPTINRLLGSSTTTGLAQALRPAASLAHRYGLPLRLDEVNSVTCGGRPGVSNTFASALWFPEAMLKLRQAGVDGVNLHMRDDAINGPFERTRGGFEPRPLLRGMVLLARTLGRHAQIVGVHVKAPRAVRLEAWGIRVGRRALHVLLIDRTTHRVRVRLLVPAASATAAQLSAPSVRATDGVKLSRPRPLSPSRRGYYSVSVPAPGATLVSLQDVYG